MIDTKKWRENLRQMIFENEWCFRDIEERMLLDEIDSLRAELDRANKIVKWYERECGDQTTNEMYCMWDNTGMPEEYSDDIYRPTPEAYKPEVKNEKQN